MRGQKITAYFLDLPKTKKASLDLIMNYQKCCLPTKKQKQTDSKANS